MSTRSLVVIIVSFLMTSFICTSSPITEEDKTPQKESSVSVKKGGCDTTEVVQDENIYISENMLYIKTPLVNDLIYVYTTSGLCIDKFVKETELIVKDVSAYPIGVLIVTNGKNLTVKVFK